MEWYWYWIIGIIIIVVTACVAGGLSEIDTPKGFLVIGGLLGLTIYLLILILIAVT